MKLQIEVPARTTTKQIDRIVLNITNNIAIVEIWDGSNRERIEVELLPLIKDATTTQKNIIKGFVKQIISVATKVALNDIPDEVLKEETV